MKKIVISTTSFATSDKKPLELLRKNGYEVVLNPFKRKISPEELVQLSRDAVGIIAGTEAIDSVTLKKLSEVKVISRCGVGIDNIDLETAKELGIDILNTLDASDTAVAELTVALMISLLRKVSRMDCQMHQGYWRKEMGNLLSGKKVGIIGFGRIGSRVAEILCAFGCKIGYYDPFVKRETGIIQMMALPELLQWVEIISIHAAGKERLVGAKEISLMQKGTWVINTSRGELIDEAALYDALKNGYLAGAALDVFLEEPYSGPLKELPNVVLTPHIGSYAAESRVCMEIEAAQNLIQSLKKYGGRIK